MPALIPLTQVEPAMLEDLLDAAFGPDRLARTAYLIRNGMDWLPALSFAAIDDAEMLVGSIQLWPIALVTPGENKQPRSHPMLMVGPVAVLPAHQGEGYGKALMAAALSALGDNPLPQVLIGDADYYGRWGFTADQTTQWRCPGPVERERLLVRCDNPAILPREGQLGPWLGAQQA